MRASFALDMSAPQLSPPPANQGRSRRDERRPRRSSGSGTLAHGLLERDSELERIAAAIASPGGVMVVEGEPGIGKTALLAAGVELGRDAGARVLCARGGVLEHDFGHGVARQLFEETLRGASPARRGRWLEGAAALAAPVLGVGADDDGGLVDDPAFAAQHGLYWLAANLASERSVVLVVDDLQWADLASLRWLVYLARRLEGIPVLVLGAWRTSEPDAPAELLDALGGERLVPAPLSVPATAALVADRLGRPCDDQTARACHAGTHGNPLLVSELADALGADITLPVDPERVTELGGVAVARHVRGRLAGLPAAARDVAAAAAVLQTGFAPRQLAALVELPAAEVREACDRLVVMRILTAGQTLDFVHPLVRAAVYDMLTPARRAALHRRAADLLHGEGVADRAAVHLLAAERGGDAAVVERLAVAADHALAHGAVDEAVSLLRRALEEPPPVQARPGVLIRLAQAEDLAGDEAALDHAGGALALAGDADQHEAAALLLAKLLTMAGRQDESLALLAAAADALREDAPEHALRLDVQHASGSLMLAGAPPELPRRTASLLERVAPDSLDAHTLRAELASLGARTASMPASAVAQAAIDALSDGRLVADHSVPLGFYWAVSTLAHCDRLDECARWVDRRWAVMARIGATGEQGILAAQRARIALGRGELAAVVEEARFALDGNQTRGYRFFVAPAVGLQVAAHVERGELDDALDMLAAHGIAQGTTWLWHYVIPGRVALALARNDLEGARRQIADAPAERTRMPLYMAPCEVAVALACGERTEALRRAEAMLAAAKHFGAPGGLGIARRLIGLTTGGREGIGHLRAAVEQLEQSPRRLELARALVDLGAALRRQGHRADAREPLRRGMDLAHRCGATPLRARAEEELRATGARPRRLVLSGVESLTPSELRVARLAADGRSNREIAQTLFVTTATVETHMGRVFQKLDLGSRDQLAAALECG